MFDGPPNNRRDFLRTLLGRAAESVPESVAAAASVMARDGGAPSDHGAEPSAELLARSFAVPADQCDIADALVRRGRLRVAGPGRYAELFSFGPAGGPATAEWLRRVRAGSAPDRTRPRDVILVQQARAELATS